MVLSLLSAEVCAEVRVGLLNGRSPISSAPPERSILADDISLLWLDSSNPPHIIPFDAPDNALQALMQNKIDLFVSAESLDNQGLSGSQPLMTFHLCILGEQRAEMPLLVMPDIPASMRALLRHNSRVVVEGDASLYDNLRRLMRNEAGGLVAPCFMIEQFMRRAPLNNLQHRLIPGLPPLYYRAWVRAKDTGLASEINRRLSRSDNQEVRELEQRWSLPTGSVTDRRTVINSKIAQPLLLRIAVVDAHPPLIIEDEEGERRGVWHELLTSFFPRTIFSLQLMQVAGQAQAERMLKAHKVDLIMGATQGEGQGDKRFTFDHQILGMVSAKAHPLGGDLTSLQNRRLAVMRNVVDIPILRKNVKSAGLVVVDDIPHGLALVEAGGADGLIADAFSLNYELNRRSNDNLILGGIDLPEIPLRFVLPDGATVLHERVSDILEGVTAENILSSKARWIENGQHEEDNRMALWLVLLAVIAGFAVIVTIAMAARVFIHQRLNAHTHRQLNDALNLWQALLNSAPVALFVCDPAGRVVRFNEAFARSTIIPSDMAEGASLPKEAGQSMAQWLDLPNRMATLYSAEPRVDEVTLTHLPQPVTLLRWLARYTDSENVPQGMVGGWVDISEKAALEAALNQSLSHAEKASEEKTTFLARMSHDIRTPLNVILGLLDIERETHPSLELAWQASVTLRDLVGDILDLSRIEAGELQLQADTHNLRQVLVNTAAIFSSSATAKGLKWYCDIQVPENIFCRFDHVRFNQILANLLGNAIKYTEKGSVTFEVGFDAQELTVKIIDTGIGIPNERQESIFQPWFQLNANTPYSSGLGLAICNQLISLMQGSLTLQSRVSEGTTVTLCLPLEHAVAPVERAGNNTSVANACEVLLVDDFLPNLTIMSLQLTRLGHRVTACATPGEALSYLSNNQVDVLITDSQMPEMDGYQLVERILLRSMLDEVNCPPVMLGCTANALRREEERAIHAGMNALLRKPLSETRLQQALSQFLQKGDEKIDLGEIKALADQQDDMVTLMLQQLATTLASDLATLDAGTPDAQEVARVAHRLKASWNLLRLHRAEHYCLTMEKLPDFLAQGILNHTELQQVLARFICIMKKYQRLLTNNLAG
ncbi:ATP-binding protein [Pantoea sp. y20]